MLWSLPFLMSSQPTPFSLPQELFSLLSPYSLISSTLAVFSSRCIEWMSRYFHMQIPGRGSGGGNRLAPGSSSISPEAEAEAVADSVRTLVPVRVAGPHTELTFPGSRRSSERCSGSTCTLTRRHWLVLWLIILSLFVPRVWGSRCSRSDREGQPRRSQCARQRGPRSQSAGRVCLRLNGDGC